MRPLYWAVTMPHHMFTLQSSSRALRVDETQARSGCQAGRVGTSCFSTVPSTCRAHRSPGAPPAPHGATDAPSSPDVNHKKKERGSRGTALRNVVFSQEIYLTADKGPCGKQTSQCCACYHCLRLPSLPFLSHTLMRLKTPHWKTPRGFAFWKASLSGTTVLITFWVRHPQVPLPLQMDKSP